MEKNNPTEIDHEDLLSPEELAQKYSEDVASFFGTEKIEDIVVNIFDSKDKLHEYYRDKHDDKKPRDYVVAFSSGNEVAILGRDTMPADAESEGPERYKKVLKHELVHKYIWGLDGKPSSWMIEGLCCYLAKQNKNIVDNDKITVELLRSLRSTDDGKKYYIGQNMVRNIVDGHGKEKLLELFTLEDDEERLKELQKMFKWLK